MPRKKAPQIEDATPIPLATQFSLDDDLFGSLTGNARNGEAKLDLFRKDKDAGPSHMEIEGLPAIVRLAQQLCDFLDAMQSKGSH